MSAEEELYGLACQDMPVSGDEVREAMNAYVHELAEKQRGLLFGADCECGECKGVRMAADLIDPEVLNSGS